MQAQPTILVVRPRAQAQRWVQALQSLGIPARSLPLIEIGPAPDPFAVAAAHDDLRAASATAALAPVVVFVSPNAVAGFFDARGSAADVASSTEAAAAGAAAKDVVNADIKADINADANADVNANADANANANADTNADADADADAADTNADTLPLDAHAAAWPPGVRACAAGPGTVAALLEAGVPATFITAPAVGAPQVDSEALWREIKAWDWMRRPVWIARGNGGREWLAERLRAAGACVSIMQVYERARPALTPEDQSLLAAAIERHDRWIWLFSSSEAVANLQALSPGVAWAAARALATHPRIAEQARAAGFGRVETVAPDVQAVVYAARKTSP